MHVKYNKKTMKNTYTIRVLSDFEEVKRILKENGYIQKEYSYYLDIYMVSKNEDFTKINTLNDINEYALIKDENGKRKVILKGSENIEAKVYNILFIHELLYKLGYFELFFVNKDIYRYEFKIKNELKISFDLLFEKELGLFIQFDNIDKNTLKENLKILNGLGISTDNKKVKVDIIQEKLNNVLFKNMNKNNKKQ